jgi:hypothetical protein
MVFRQRQVLPDGAVATISAFRYTAGHSQTPVLPPQITAESRTTESWIGDWVDKFLELDEVAFRRLRRVLTCCSARLVA